jgi:hypothetical protein
MYVYTGLTGGRGGTPFKSNYGDHGHLVKRLEVWQGAWQLHGIRVTFTNDRVEMIGTQTGRYAGTFDLGVGERITSLSVWGNGAGTRCGAFKIRTSNNREYFPKMYEWGLKTEYPQIVASGYLCGIEGSANWDIDNLGFIFLKPVKNSTLKEVSYPNLNSSLVATTPFILDSLTIDNQQGSVAQESTLEGRQELEETREWSNSTGIEMSITSSVKAGIPEIVDVSIETSVKVSNTFTFGRSQTKKITKSASHKITCPPKSLLKASLTTYQDTLDIDYTGKVELEFQDGDRFSYPVKGIYKGASARSIFLKISDGKSEEIRTV